MDKRIIKTKNAPAPIGPYNQAIFSGNTLYVSGQIAIDPVTGNMISDNIDAETHQVMKNLGNILQAAGLNYNHVVKCTIFVNDMNNFLKVNEAYGSYFVQDPPARETVEVSGLPKGVNVEISCIAVK